MKKVKLQIEGMHCQSCNILILDILEDHNAKGTFEGSQLTVEYNPDEVDLNKIIKDIESEEEFKVILLEQ